MEIKSNCGSFFLFHIPRGIKLKFNALAFIC